MTLPPTMTAVTTRTEALFIGGSADGRRIALDAPFPSVNVPSPRGQSVDAAPKFKIEVYHRHELLVGCETLTVYTLGNMSTLVVMRRLINGYGNAKIRHRSCTISKHGLNGPRNDSQLANRD